MKRSENQAVGEWIERTRIFSIEGKDLGRDIVVSLK